MTEEERKALAALRFDWAPTPDDVWGSARYHVEGLHSQVAQTVLAGVAEAEANQGGSPIGVVIQGQRGAGKTHLLGWMRARVIADGGYFFLVGLLDAGQFWPTVLSAMLSGLSRKVDAGGTQLQILLRRLADQAGVSRHVRRAVAGETPLSRETLDAFVDSLRRLDNQVARECQDTIRALALRASENGTAQDVADTFLSAADEEEPGERGLWGMRRSRRSEQEIVHDLSRLLALTGPSVIAIDQIDTCIAQSALSTDVAARDDWQDALLLEQVAGGLMSLRELTRRTLTVVACIPTTWALIKKRATDTVQDRFRETVQLKNIPTADVGRALIEKRFAVHFGDIEFVPPYPTWPVRPSAFDDAHFFTPRQLLQNIDAHIRSCLVDDEVTELERLGRPRAAAAVDGLGEPPPVASAGELSVLDARFAELTGAAQVDAATDGKTEDAWMPALLSAGLSAWIVELGEAGRVFEQDPPPSTKPPLHARLRRTLDEATEDQIHWGFRAIGAENARAALYRLRDASLAAGLSDGVAKRKLFLLRNLEWSRGPKTQEAIAAFTQAGGRTLRVGPDDLKVLAALRELQRENPPNLQAWLVARKPTGRVALLRHALAGAAADLLPPEPGDAPRLPAQRAVDGGATADAPAVTAASDAGRAAESSAERGTAEYEIVAAAAGRGPAIGRASVPGMAPAPVPAQASPVPAQPSPVPAQASPVPVMEAGAGAESDPATAKPAVRPAHQGAPVASITIGAAMEGGAPVRVPLEALRKHTAIFAGSGSGKTVLIRRLVEECALQGVSSIVLDPNNDLARLGDPWPEPPSAWGDGDAAAAAEYLASTDVVIWTPRRVGGRPLSFRPLPDFASVVDNADEFGDAVEAAVASLAPRAKLDGKTTKALLGQAVLRQALRYYGRHGTGNLKGFIALLAVLPDGISDLDNAEKIAGEIAQTLTAAMVNDPLFGGDGAPADPALLLTPPPGKRARVSVISLAGLTSDEQRQSFVNQLQMALFAWIKRNPAGDRPLGGLFVMDEAQTLAPSGAMTACTLSTLALASQARKYGLGLVFATQAPRGLHNRIPGNAATQFFGLLNSPIQIAAAKEMAQAKGSQVPDIGRLRTGQFYVAVEGAEFAKAQTPLCLSYHPKSPLTIEEVIERARDDRE